MIPLFSNFIIITTENSSKCLFDITGLVYRKLVHNGRNAITNLDYIIRDYGIIFPLYCLKLSHNAVAAQKKNKRSASGLIMLFFIKEK